MNSDVSGRCLTVVAEFERFNASLAGIDACSRLQAARQQLVELACQLFAECQWAAITSWPPGLAPLTLAATGDIPRLIDTIHCTVNEGPCPDVATDTTCTPVKIGDVTHEQRWPSFTAEVLHTPVRAMLSYRLPGPCDWCTLTLYTEHAGNFDQEDTVRIGSLFATHASIALIRALNASQAASARTTTGPDHLIRSAIDTIMRTHSVSEEVASEILQRGSTTSAPHDGTSLTS